MRALLGMNRKLALRAGVVSCLFCVISGSGREGKDPEEWPYPVSDL